MIDTCQWLHCTALFTGPCCCAAFCGVCCVLCHCVGSAGADGAGHTGMPARGGAHTGGGRHTQVGFCCVWCWSCSLLPAVQLFLRLCRVTIGRKRGVSTHNITDVHHAHHRMHTTHCVRWCQCNQTPPSGLCMAYSGKHSPHSVLHLPVLFIACCSVVLCCDVLRRPMHVTAVPGASRPLSG